MLGAPPGFIPLGDNIIVNAREIIAVYETSDMEIDPDSQKEYDAKMKEVRETSRYYVADYTWMIRYRPIGTTHITVVWSKESVPNRSTVENMSLIQFSARMTEAIEESK